MGLFSSNRYERAGSGIAKGTPKKKGFFRYMEIWTRKFWQLIELNLLYFVFFLPLVAAAVFVFLIFGEKIDSSLGAAFAFLFGAIFAILIGPATAGFTKILRNYTIEKPCFLTHDFFHTFKSEFKNSCIVGIIDCVIATSLGSAFYVYPKLIDQTGNNIFYVFFAITISIGLIVFLMNFYVFLMLISTNLSLKNTLKNSFALAIVALKNNIITLAILAAFVAVYVLLLVFVNLKYSMILIFLMPFLPGAWMGLVIAFNCYPVIQKYIINPFYEQRGEINPELKAEMERNEDETVFEDMGGKEAPINPDKKSKKVRTAGSEKNHKGKIIS